MPLNDIVSGLSVTVTSPSSMGVTVTDGVVLTTDQLVPVTRATLSVQPATVNARFDTVVLNADRTLSVVTAGSAAPAADSTPLASIYVLPGVTAIHSGDITNLDTSGTWNNLDNISALVRRLAQALTDLSKHISTSGVADSTISSMAISATTIASAAAGTSDTGNSAYISAVQGDVYDNGDPLAKTHNYYGGVHGRYSITNTNASVYPKGAVLGSIGAGSSTADGAFVAVIDGDATLTSAPAAFKVKAINTNVGSNLAYGLDLQDAAKSGINIAVDKSFYTKAPIRMPDDCVILPGAGVPSDGTTGANFAGPGSLYIDQTNKNAYINANTIGSPTWKLITRAA